MNIRVYNALRKEARVNAFVRFARKVGLAKMPKGGLGIGGLVDILPAGSNKSGLSALIKKVNSYRQDFKQTTQGINDYAANNKLDDRLYSVFRRLGNYLVPKNLKNINYPEAVRLDNILSSRHREDWERYHQLQENITKLRELNHSRGALIKLIKKTKRRKSHRDLLQPALREL